MKKTEGSDAFYEMKHRHDDPVTSLDCANIHKSITYVATRLAKCTNQQAISQQNTHNTTSWRFYASKKNECSFKSDPSEENMWEQHSS